MNVRERMLSLSLLALEPAPARVLREIGVTAKLKKVNKGVDKTKKKKKKA